MASKNQPIIDRNVALNIIALVDYCYRKGVEDAHRIDDEGLAREFLEKVSRVGVYGFLNEDGITMSWKEWTLRLMAKARMTSWNGAMSRYFSLIGARPNQNYLGVFIPVSQAFYTKGVRNYVDNPHSANSTLFQEKTRVFWTAKGLQNVNTRRYTDEIQLCCFDLQRRDAKVWETHTVSEANKLGAIKPKQYDSYIRAIGLALMSKDCI